MLILILMLMYMLVVMLMRIEGASGEMSLTA